jgi:hypothetical protein
MHMHYGKLLFGRHIRIGFRVGFNINQVRVKRVTIPAAWRIQL